MVIKGLRHEYFLLFVLIKKHKSYLVRISKILPRKDINSKVGKSYICLTNVTHSLEPCTLVYYIL